MVLLDSHEVSRASQYSGTDCTPFGFKYGTFTPYGVAFQPASSTYSMIASVSPTTPIGQILQVWPLPISLAATLGVSFDFFSSRY